MDEQTFPMFNKVSDEEERRDSTRLRALRQGPEALAQWESDDKKRLNDKRRIYI